MSSPHAKPVSSDVTSPPLLLCAMMFLDPRRWVGAVLAILGLLISIIAPLMPSFLFKRITHPAGEGSPSIRHVLTPGQPPPTLIQSSTIMPTAIHSIRPSTAGDVPVSPRVTFSFGPHPRSVTTDSLTEYSFNSSPSGDASLLRKSCLLSFHDSKLASPSSSPASSVTLLPPSVVSSVDSSDFASDISTHTTQQATGQSSRRPLCLVQVSKLGLTRRRSVTDLKALKKVSQGLPKLQENQISASEWRGTSAFAVRRSNTLSTPLDARAEVTSSTSLTLRRKITLLTRDSPPISPGKEKAPLPHTMPAAARRHSAPVATRLRDSTVPPVPTLPSPSTMQRLVDSLPPNVSAVPGPSESLIASSPMLRIVPEDMIPLEKTTTPPARPSRTDPYKTHGVPVPGSERARAFLKAEKERTRVEKERRERERAEKREEVMRVVRKEDGEGSLHGHGEDKSGSRKRCPIISKKGKDLPAVAVQSPGLALTMDQGDDMSIDSNNSTARTRGPDEFGVLPALDVSSASERTQTRPQSSQGRRGWTFSWRGSEFDGAYEKEKQGSEKDQDRRVDSARIRKRPKSGDASKRSKMFRSKSRKTKDRGYSSDTGVPSLAYRLIS